MARTNNPITLFSAQDGSGAFTLPAAGQAVSRLNPFTVELEWTGTLTGDLQVQTSIDGTLWADEGAAVSMGGAPGDARVTVTDVVGFVRVDRVTPGGAGDVSARVLGIE